jgi:hypothetical protein
MAWNRIAAVIAISGLAASAPAFAQTTQQTKVEHNTSTANGVATETTKTTHLTKRSTHHPKKVLGVKVGEKTAVHKTVKETSVSSNGDTNMTVKTSN